MFGLLSFIPIMQMWWYHDWVEVVIAPSPCVVFLSYWTMWIFQLAWGVFTTLQSCLWVELHKQAVHVVILSLVIHHLVVGCACSVRLRTYKPVCIPLVIIISVYGCVVFLTWSQYQDCRIYWWSCTYGFWFAECLMVFLTWAIVPGLWFFGGVELPVMKPPSKVVLLE